MFNLFDMFDASKRNAMNEAVLVMNKRRNCLKNLFLNESFLVEVSMIPKSHIESIMDCMYKYAPELSLIDKEVIELGKVITPEKDELQVLQEANDAFELFENMRNKNFAAFIAVRDNTAYHDEISLLAKKYDKNNNFQAYLDACTEVFHRYIDSKIM